MTWNRKLDDYWDIEKNCRKVAYYKRDQSKRKLGKPPSIPLLACSHCDATANHLDYLMQEKRVRVCRRCGYSLRKRPTVTRRSQSDEQLLHKAQQQSEKILTDIGRKMTSLKKHQKRIKYYTAKLEGRLKKSTPKKKSTPIRKITVA
jgi:NMD protein affecting ribosome stability and mRNA decay